MHAYSTPKALESLLKVPEEHRSLKCYTDRKEFERHMAIINQRKWPRLWLLNRKYQKQRQIPAEKGVLVYCDINPDQDRS